jgi:isocitrate lyase
LAGFHALNTRLNCQEPTKKEEWQYSELQENCFAKYNFKETPRFVGTSYLDAVRNTVTIGKSTTTAKDLLQKRRSLNI